MKKSWKFFIFIELLLLMFAFMQLSNSTPLMIFVGLTIFCLVYTWRKPKKTSFHYFMLTLSTILLILVMLSSPFVWGMFLFAVVFILIEGIEASGLNLSDRAPWNKKQMIMPEFVESSSKNSRRFKRKWFGNERIGSNVYEWDDINFSIVSGDTIVDLGNTILPKEDNIIMIRKGLGRTRILIPVGVGVMLEHSTFRGNVIFDGEYYSLKNESVKLYSNNYDDNQRRLKILTNTLMGDIEVIRV